VVEWSLAVLRHLAHCRIFAGQILHRGESEVIDDAFRLYADSWNRQASFTDSAYCLSGHRAKLVALRGDYAAKFAERISVKVTIS
jgi:hypothetical protein